MSAPIEIPRGYCQCGCGQKTNLADRDNPRRGDVKGEPLRYVARHNPRTPPPDYGGRRAK